MEICQYLLWINSRLKLQSMVRRRQVTASRQSVPHIDTMGDCVEMLMLVCYRKGGFSTYRY